MDGARLLAVVAPGSRRRRSVRDRSRTDHAQTSLPAGPPVRSLADLRGGPGGAGRLPQPVRLLGAALHGACAAHRRLQPRLHVPADLPGVGRRVLARRLLRHLVRDRAHEARRLPARGHREPDAGAGLRHQRAAHDHAHLWLRRGPGGARRRAGGADLPGQPVDGRRPHHRRLRGGRHRRPGLDHGLHRDGLRARRDRGLHQSLLPGGLEHRDLRDHGAGAAGPPGRTLRTRDVSTLTAPGTSARPVAVEISGTTPIHQIVAFGAMVTLLVLAPFVVYPVFLMKALCFALFACAFNLLVGYVGLLSFGHAAFLGCAGYASAHAAKVWGFAPESAIVFGTLVAAALGVVIGALTIRSRGIYFANITLAFAQMIFFFSLQAKFTGGEDGIQSVNFACSERSEEHTSELQSRLHLVCRLLLEKKKNYILGTQDAPHARAA